MIVIGEPETFEPPFTPEQRLRAVMIFGEPFVQVLEQSKREDDGYEQVFIISPDEKPIKFNKVPW